jgi:diacylglycerol O-acyltransferase
MSTAPRRLSEADAAFVALGEAIDAPYVPVTVAVYERPFDDPATLEHLNEVMARLLPPMRQRITRDRASTALHRWEDVPGFDLADHTVVLPPPGDGTLRGVLEWAEGWSRLPLPVDRPPWRSAYFEGVTVDGVPDRLVVVSQFHHAMIDGQGAAKLGEHFYQWEPDGSLPEMPSPLEPDRRTKGEHWRAGWALEGTKARELLRNTGRRLRWAASDPAAGLARAKALGEAMGRLNAQSGMTPLSPLLCRTSDRNRFDMLRVDLAALRAGARAVGGSANDGLMAAVSLGLHRWHLDHGVRVPEVRTLMPISTRGADDGHAGNEVLGAFVGLPLLDDADAAVKSCAAVSRACRDDADVLWLFDRFRAASNRLPKRIVAQTNSLKGIDLSLSNVKGMPLRNWIAGVEILETTAFLIGGPAVAMTLISGPEHSTLGVVTCPEAVTDPEHLMDRVSEGIAQVSALAEA